MIDALRRLYDSGVKRPSFTIGDVRVSFDPLTGRLFALYGGDRIGTVKSSGLFVPAPGSKLMAQQLLKKIVEHPLEAAVAGLLLGDRARCAICRVPLDKKDRERGIGAKCWEKAFEKEASVGDRVSSKLGTRRRFGVKHNKRRHENG
jgi:hypothetical protein